MDAVKTGTLIRKCRTEKNYTQKQLAEMINVSAYAVSKWENGRGMPDISLLEDLAHALDISIEELVMGEEKAMTQNNDESLQQLIDAAKKQTRRKTIFTMLATALSVFLIGLIGWNIRKWYLSTQKSPVRYAETAEPGGDGREGKIILQRNIWIENKPENNNDRMYFTYFGPYASYKIGWTNFNKEGDVEELFFMRMDNSTNDHKEYYFCNLATNGEADCFADENNETRKLTKVWYYSGNDPKILEYYDDQHTPDETRRENLDYVYGHWDEITADSILLYDYEHPELTKRQFQYTKETSD